MRSERAYRVSLRKIRFDRRALLEILQNGLPAGLQNSIISIGNVVVQSNINQFGAAAMAGCGAHSRIEGFGFLPVTCFTMALTTFVSQNLGAIFRGAGKSTVPMLVMMLCWCIIRVIYVTVAVKFFPVLQTVSWAYPITWGLSTLVFTLYYFKADWMHAFERREKHA